jgi:release factor glutamine methyltransferase
LLIVETLAEVGDSLNIAGIESARAEARQLVAHAMGVTLSELDLRLSLGFGLDAQQLKTLYASLERRVRREPLQHILGTAGFRHLVLEVGLGVFVPRPETEAVAQLAIDFLSERPGALALDVGTGSGAIALALATETSSRVVAIELSPDAAAFAKKNIDRYQAAIELRVGDFRDALDLHGQLDLLISNPPYIPEGAIPIDPEVRDYDPPLALYSGADGLDLIRELIEVAEHLLKPDGLLVLEHADGQSDQVVQLLLSRGWQPTAHPDATQRLRAVTAIR